MAKGIYIGISSDEKLIKFTSSITPTTWSVVTNYTKYTGENEYGTWTLESTKEPTNGTSSNAIASAFDGDSTTLSSIFFDTVTDGSATEYHYLTLPSGILINPKTFTVLTPSNSASGHIEIYDIENDTWVDIGGIGSNTTSTLTYNGDIYTNKIRVRMYTSASIKSFSMYEFKLIEGTIKIAEAQNNIARKVTKAYVGVSNKARKVKKGYIGVGGVARQFYSSETLVPFTSSPVPIAWTDISDGLAASTTNDYGTWSIEASSRHAANYQVSKAFDGIDSDNWKSSDSNTVDNIFLHCPNGVYIKPNTISIRYSRLGISNIYGSCPGDPTWTLICSTTKKSTSIYTETFNYTGDKYFSNFYIRAVRYSDTYTDKNIYNFKITSGTLKIE